MPESAIATAPVTPAAKPETPVVPAGKAAGSKGAAEKVPAEVTLKQFAEGKFYAESEAGIPDAPQPGAEAETQTTAAGQPVENSAPATTETQAVSGPGTTTEATRPPQEAPAGSPELSARREEVRTQLGEMGRILLETGDERVFMVASARAAGDTPLADQYRETVLSQLADTVHLAPDHGSRAALDGILAKTRELLPETEEKFFRTPFAEFLKSRGLGYVVPMVEDGRMDAVTVFSQISARQAGDAKSAAATASELWSAMGGTPDTLPVSSESVVRAATSGEVKGDYVNAVDRMKRERRWENIKMSAKLTGRREVQRMMVVLMVVGMLAQFAQVLETGGSKGGH
ncbi:hypothetical protein A2Z33_07655 [Candidatus Gottesmanbacteria bacterium RBG_16_52_11]|uniref:Uncharacterized protein n=1 Tax=Candidatus Gottesmanbacteria bacterium RBG_16_52_11 TaxID=1798374 RepID=A0A1F5YNG1_9BACT|nr:MAG: hypothetical protein A2Z33_07655 [Candidatus Gottesmanbacteria bacterium RBG_16_52_11]